jgi:exodeoxyribonuclease VII small subunit
VADDKYTFEQARIRLEEIATEVRKKDTSLEKSLDLLEEGVRLANICTELVDHTDVSATVVVPVPDVAETAVEKTETTGESSTEGDSDEVSETPADEPDGFEDADEQIAEPADAEADE